MGHSWDIAHNECQRLATIERRVSKEGVVSYRAKVRLRGDKPRSRTFDAKAMRKPGRRQQKPTSAAACTSRRRPTAAAPSPNSSTRPSATTSPRSATTSPQTRSGASPLVARRDRRTDAGALHAAAHRRGTRPAHQPQVQAWRPSLPSVSQSLRSCPKPWCSRRSSRRIWASVFGQRATAGTLTSAVSPTLAMVSSVR